MNRPGNRARVPLRAFSAGGATDRSDYVATEEPLEIRVVAGGQTKTVAVTMRTPGNDFELAAGFLFSEGVISSGSDVRAIRYCVDREVGEEQRFNIVNVELAGDALPDLAGLERHFFTSSACGVCGKAALDALAVRCPRVADGPPVEASLLATLPEAMREAQKTFDSTGGLHAATLFSEAGDLVAVREDVGRHNALDKVIGWAVLDGQLPLSDRIVMVSGRASFELLQKAAMSGAPIFCSVSAPSSLAVETARTFGITLVGFLRDNRFNVYTAGNRVRGAIEGTQT